MCCSVNGSVCLVCCVFDSVCELFGEVIRNMFGCDLYVQKWESLKVYLKLLNLKILDFQGCSHFRCFFFTGAYSLREPHVH